MAGRLSKLVRIANQRSGSELADAINIAIKGAGCLYLAANFRAAKAASPLASCHV